MSRSISLNDFAIDIFGNYYIVYDMDWKLTGEPEIYVRPRKPPFISRKIIVQDKNYIFEDGATVRFIPQID